MNGHQKRLVHFAISSENVEIGQGRNFVLFLFSFDDSLEGFGGGAIDGQLLDSEHKFGGVFGLFVLFPKGIGGRETEIFGFFAQEFNISKWAMADRIGEILFEGDDFVREHFCSSEPCLCNYFVVPLAIHDDLLIL